MYLLYPNLEIVSCKAIIITCLGFYQFAFVIGHVVFLENKSVENDSSMLNPMDLSILFTILYSLLVIVFYFERPIFIVEHVLFSSKLFIRKNIKIHITHIVQNHFIVYQKYAKLTCFLLQNSFTRNYQLVYV